MNFLPVVTRELRVASRRKTTYWIRASAALAAIALGSFFLISFSASPGGNNGQWMFRVLSYYAFILCSLAGAFITADSLSQEKREGTLGLLFLTDLRGYDVVLGKFAAMSLNTIYGLVAVFPILAISLIVGGVTGGEFWRMTLALLNALFFSLALGMCVSAQSRDSQRAAGNTLAITVLFVVALPLLWRIPLVGPFLSGYADLSLVSPFTTFRLAFESGFRSANQFHLSLLLSQAVGWIFIAVASLILPRAWQDKPHRAAALRSSWLSGGRTRDPVEREKLLSINPVLWLLSGGRRLRWVIWSLAAAVAITCFLTQHWAPGLGSLAFWISTPFLILFKIIIALRTTSFYAEARRSGGLELLLTTPLTNRQIMQGHWLAMRRAFFWPVAVIVIALLYPLAAQLRASLFDYERLMESTFLAVPVFYGAIRFIADVLAVIWFGMWMALSSKKPALAGGWTVLIAVLGPTVLTTCCWADLVLDLFLIFWSKGKLELDLRRYLAGTPPSFAHQQQ